MLKKLKTSILVLAFFLIQSSNSFANQFSTKHVTVLAESNMAFAITKVARLYAREKNVVVSVNFNSPAELINSIDSGEPADIFISGHLGWITALKHKGLVDVYNVSDIAFDQLVLVSNSKNVNIFPELRQEIAMKSAMEILDKNKMTLIVDHEGSSLGKYSAMILRDTPKSNLKLFKKLEEDRESIVNSIRNNQDYYAILLASQVKNRKEFLTIARQPDMEISYQALVIAGDNMANAREFAKFLSSSGAKEIFRQNGFIVK